MLFNSLAFAVFFPTVVLMFFLLPHRFRWALLLLASCVFYSFFIPAYLLILAFTIVVDYYAGLWIERAVDLRRRRWLLGASIIANAGVLVVFKYFNFAIGNLNAIAEMLGWNYSLPLLQIILPIGLSFHTFQAMSYTIEVYRGKQAAERHFGIYALYVMFFPQLVAGPIERPQNILHQFHEIKRPDAERFTSGLRLMLWGLFKKVVIADTLAVSVNKVFATPAEFHGLAYLTAAVFFAVQIYCDFSGYSDVARGAARVLGFELMVNFRRPYFASSLSDFWRRWHISLSTWFRDYLYFPLGGSRVPALRHALNLFVVFLVSGLWHGAAWTFVIWGGLHGVVLAIGALFERWQQAQPAFFKGSAWLVSAMNVVIALTTVLVGWIFFRAASLSDALLICGKLFHETGYGVLTLLGQTPTTLSGLEFIEGGTPGLLFALLLIAFLMLVELVLELRPVWLQPARFVAPVRWAAYATLTLAILYSTHTAQPFIYFQF